MPADVAPEETTPTATRRPISRGTIVVLIISALFYAYALWEALGNLIQVPQLYRDNKLDASTVPWFWLIAGVISPILIYLLAVFTARRQGLLGRCIILFVGLAVTSALYLTIVELPSLI
jgi:hypothetical protein